MKNESITTDVLLIYYEAFKQAISICNKNGAQIKIVSEVKKEINYYRITLETPNVIDFYNLGLKYGILKATI